VKDRSVNFIEEYILSQMFMQWVKNSDSFDGIRYKSSLYTSMVNGFGAINIALPVKEFRADGLCQNLTSKIQVSDIAYMDLSAHFESYKKYLVELAVFKVKVLSRKEDAVFSSVYSYEIEEICDNIIETYSAIIDGSITDLDLALYNINCLIRHIQLMKDATEVIVTKAKASAKAHGSDIDEHTIAETVTTDINTFHEICSKFVHSDIPFYFEKQQLGNFELI